MVTGGSERSTRCNTTTSFKTPILTLYCLVSDGCLGRSWLSSQRAIVMAQLLKPLPVRGQGGQKVRGPLEVAPDQGISLDCKRDEGRRRKRISLIWVSSWYSHKTKHVGTTGTGRCCGMGTSSHGKRWGERAETL